MRQRTLLFSKEIFNNNILNNRLNRDRRYDYEQKRKIITFEDSHISKPIFNVNVPLDNSLHYISTPVQREGTESENALASREGTSTQFLQFNSIQNNTIERNTKDRNFTSTEICNFKSVLSDGNDEDNINLTAADLLDYKQIQNETLEDHPGVSRLDFLRPLDVNSEKLTSESLNESINIFNFERCTPLHGNKPGKDVSWNEMFDTELLPDIIAPVVEEKSIAAQNAIANEKPFKISFPEDIIKGPVINSKQSKIKIIEDKTEINSNLKFVKRKKDVTSTKNKASKRLKENNVKQNKTKKEKYRKTVENWLDGVDPDDCVEVGKNAITKPIKSGTKIKTLHKIVKDTLVPKEQNVPKKTIQAHLKNKGGIMKFSKPEVLKEDTNAPEGTGTEAVIKGANRVNVKKSKPKFIAPLKSQVPVKEIQFTVVVIDETNWSEHIVKFENSKFTELYAVLMFSNGLCQLNKQFTDEECIPEGVMLHIDDEFYYFKKTEDKFSDIIIKFLENKIVVCQDGKNILIFFKHNFDFVVDIVIHDVKIGASLLEPDNPAETFSDLQKLMSTTPDYSIATECKLQKTAWYLTLMRDCADKLKVKLLEHSLWRLFVDIEMKVLPIIADMEFRGIHVNTEELKSMEGILLSRMKAVEMECHRVAGKTFQMTSPTQVAAILYDELQLHAKCNLVVKETMSKGAKSTSESMLRTLVPLHPLPGLILEYRRLHKAHATFLAGIGQHVKDGVIKPIWVQTAAATGRIAASNPNLQAIPKAPFSLSSNADNTEGALNLRSIYIARPGWLLLAADFKQVECRVFASAAADTALLGALRSAGDLFTVLASKWLNKPERDVSAADRERTKRIVYARLYGAGARKLMDILDITYEQALSVQDSFDRTFPSLKSFGASVARSCAEGRAPRTAAGRARPLPALRSADAAQRAHAQRQALNFLVQGTAADICKIAMSSAQSQLKSAGIRAHLLLQIHDELVWEVAEDQLAAAHAIIRSAMESSGRAAGLETLPVTAAAARCWGRLAPV
ncbi:DNA polymerase I-like isoform X2 [Plodia interpunctella]|uniref:DNA polymerase I-like isoform X2 n=1 Tax=Plodia interpunctella TaxID=58824 RepID=UPI002368D720|nr:DNA polymerase I-like isoform X2 [Plodia interpunctella]